MSRPQQEYTKVVKYPNGTVVRRKEPKNRSTTKAQRDAVYKNQAKNVKRYPGMALNKNSDADLIELFDAVDNRQGLIKAAVRSYVKNHKVALKSGEKVYFEPSASEE